VPMAISTHHLRSMFLIIKSSNYFVSLGMSVVERIYGGILVVPPPKYPHIFP
jgi:hypothetical protein